MDSLLDREDVQSGGAVVEDGEGGDDVEPSSPVTDDEDIPDDTFPELGSPSSPTTLAASASANANAVAVAPPPDTDRETTALEFIARLRRKFGALLFTLASTGVAVDNVVGVRIREGVRCRWRRFLRV